jgi:hypothetical protein
LPSAAQAALAVRAKAEVRAAAMTRLQVEFFMTTIPFGEFQSRRGTGHAFRNVRCTNIATSGPKTQLIEINHMVLIQAILNTAEVGRWQ